MKEKNKTKKSVLHKISIALLIVGLIISIIAFASSILGLIGYTFIYFGGIAAFLAVVAIIYLVVILTAGVLFGIVNFIIIFIEAFISALANSSSSMDFKGVWPNIDWNLISPSTWEIFGFSVLGGTLVFPFLIVASVTSFFAMIFAIIALANVGKGKSKGGMITGGVFAILSSLNGTFSLLEFIGGVLAFIPRIKKPEEKK